MRTRVTLPILVLLISGCAESAPPADVDVGLETLFDDLEKPTYATEHGSRFYVIEQEGVIRWFADGDEGTFLDIKDKVGNGGERGLLGLAFDPDFDENGRFFVHYTDENGDTVLARYESQDGKTADEGRAKTLLTQDQPYANHNGGMLEFGRDGYLYMGLGDGGSGGDPHGNGQKLTTILGKILRLDVSGDSVTCPASNPDLGDDARCEIWSYGLRNPWRFSFDRENGDMWIGDVGQNQWEEVNRSPGSSKGGENYGWNIYEGTHRFRSGGNPDDYVEPIIDYATGPGGTCSVTGGYVYRGNDIPGLRGQYVFADYCAGIIWTLQENGTKMERFELFDAGFRISSFGETEDGEILVVDHGGSVRKLVSK